MNATNNTNMILMLVPMILWALIMWFNMRRKKQAASDAAIERSNVEDIACMMLIRSICDLEEGSTVVLTGSNPDFDNGPNYAIEIDGTWRIGDEQSTVGPVWVWDTRRFTGDTLLDCLRAGAQEKGVTKTIDSVLQRYGV